MPHEAFSHSEIVSLEARRSERLRMLWAGELVLRKGRYDCRVLDISQHGAKISTDTDIAPGEDGLLLCEGLDVLFRVVRCEPDCVAVTFVDEFEQDELESDTEYTSRVARNQQIFRYLASGIGPPLRPRAED